MKSLFPMILIAGVMLSGCASRNNGDSASGSASATRSGAPSAPAGAESSGTEASGLIVTPGSALTGKVAVYNDAGQFVVLDFPLGQMPATEQRMFVYRGGLKVGEVRITGPQRENRTVADLVAGEARRGDDVRDK